MGAEWYDIIARRNGGYRSNSNYIVEGISGESVFRDRLIELLGSYPLALDAGCGHGDFTLGLAPYAKLIIGFDFSFEMIKIANQVLRQSSITNVQFIHATTKTKLPFEDNQFDLIYDRRGPTSILNHSRILRPGGLVFGIHSAARNLVKERLLSNGFIDVEIEEFSDAVIRFDDENEFMKFMSAIPGNPDYALLENRDQFKQLLCDYRGQKGLSVPELRYIWKARKSDVPPEAH